MTEKNATISTMAELNHRITELNMSLFNPDTGEWRFRPGYQVVWPGDGSDPYIEFTWRENEKPKRYKLEAFVEKLAEMGILQEIKEDCRG